MIERRRAAGCALVILTALAMAACSGGVEARGTPTPAPVSDPAGPGPYAVGLTHLTFQRPSNADQSPRVLDTWVWYPAAGDPASSVTEDAPPLTGHGAFPVVVFSHGSGGEPQFQRYLTEHLASWGFVVAAPPHPGNTTADCVLCDFQNILASARERPDDVTFVLAQMRALRDDASQPLGAVIDTEHAAIAGHSFGGWTALFVAAGGPFDAAVALAPGQPETLLQRVAGINIPVLIIGGGKDEIVPAASVQKLWEALPSGIDRAYVSLPEGHHLTFVDRCLGCTEALPEKRGHELTDGYTTAFLMDHLYGDTRYGAYVDAAQPPDAVLVAP
jgi:predicted dienelactone hydrolase